jgi:hypothetical protein
MTVILVALLYNNFSIYQRTPNSKTIFSPGDSYYTNEADSTTRRW